MSLQKGEGRKIQPSFDKVILGSEGTPLYIHEKIMVRDVLSEAALKIIIPTQKCTKLFSVC
jgi:hypothetical protein